MKKMTCCFNRSSKFCSFCLVSQEFYCHKLTLSHMVLSHFFFPMRNDVTVDTEMIYCWLLTQNAFPPFLFPMDLCVQDSSLAWRGDIVPVMCLSTVMRVRMALSDWMDILHVRNNDSLPSVGHEHKIRALNPRCGWAELWPVEQKEQKDNRSLMILLVCRINKS
jgi:hypothetical protein